MPEQKKPRILIVHNYYQIPGGEDTVVANEKKLLEDHGYRVVMYTRNNNEIKTMSRFGKLLLPFVNVYNPRTARDIRRIIKNQGIDIVHVHNTLNLISPSVYYAAGRCGVPVIQTMHNFRLLCPGATFYRDGHICEDCVAKGLGCAIRHGCYRESRAQTLICVISTWIHRMTGIYGKINYIALTEFNKDKLLLLKQIKPEKIFVKPNFTFENPVEHKSNDYYLYIGRIEKIKGVDILMEAFEQLPEQKLYLAGTGTELERYRSLAEQMGMGNVRFLGFQDRDRLNELLSHAKAVIVSSQWYETFGMSIIEAYSSGVPVIVGNLGNVASLVREGITGAKFVFDDADSLRETVSHFEVGSKGAAAKTEYKKKYSPEENLRILEEIYDSLFSP